MTEREAAALYRLMTWLSPAFPVGAFSYSSGIEWAVEAGDIIDAASLRTGWPRCSPTARAFATACFWRMRIARVERGDDGRACAKSPNSPPPSCRRASASSRPRRRAAPSSRSRARPGIATGSIDVDRGHATGAIVYPVAVGVVSAAHGIPLAPTLHALPACAGLELDFRRRRLIPLGQTDSQRVLAALEPVVAATAARALDASLDDLGSATFRADLASMRHETQYTRLFRS